VLVVSGIGTYGLCAWDLRNSTDRTLRYVPGRPEEPGEQARPSAVDYVALPAQARDGGDDR
jgi:hypothetical protein